jgi:nucleotide-binding universal stress UspA family protein
MTAITRILLATDLEPHSDRAMERAVHLARHFGADLTALYAIRTGTERGLLDNLPPHHIEAEMRRHLETVAGAKELAPMVVAAKGPVEQAMALYAQLWKADLMVAGRTEPDGGLLSVSTVERISVASPVPLLTVTAKPFAPYSCALVPVDFSALSQPALQAALALVPAGAVELFHAYDAPLSRAELNLAVSAEDFAADFAPLLDGVPSAERLLTTSVRMGAPVATILDAACRSPATDLIVMGSAGRSGLGRALVGSVAHAVLERAPCDVLIVQERSVAANTGGP